MCNNVDWDDVLSYPTIKVVKVRDRYLGCIRYLMLFFIVAYILGYVIIYQKGYYECEVPTGAIELSLKKPDGYLYPWNYSYCLQSKDNTGIIDPLSCQIVDESDVYIPVDQSNAMFITTRFSQTLENRVCNNLNDSCEYPWETANDSQYNGVEYYSAAISNFTIRMSHFFQARDFYIEYHDSYYSQSCAQMNGKLINFKSSKTLMKFGNNETDIIPLSLLLEASDTILDSQSDDPSDDNESKRHAGIVLLVGIDYSNEHSSQVKYTYTVTRVPKVEYKVTTTQMINTTQRLVNDRHGVKLFFIYSGNICKFDFQTMLINFVSGIGLLSVATVITDLLMVYVLPLKNMYTKYKYQVTKDHAALEKRATFHHLNVDETASDVQSNFSDYNMKIGEKQKVVTSVSPKNKANSSGGQIKRVTPNDNAGNMDAISSSLLGTQGTEHIGHQASSQQYNRI